MAIYLDEQELTLEATSLKDVVQAANAQALSQGRIVVEISLDGQVIPADQLASRQAESLPQGKDVHLVSSRPSELAIDTLNQCLQSLDEARKITSDAAQLLQQDDTTAAIEQIAQSMSIWQQVQAVVSQSTQLTGIDLNTRELDGEPINDIIRKHVTHLTELRDLLKAKDSLGLADVLTYEWPSVLDRWQQLVGEMITWIEEEDKTND
ncbi:MAG: hypothetical protein JKX85_16350 [Phycisphaeraceae bacterium]|nr:hypothetical protein [Phycisphaeraceae bacterium]